MSGAECRVQVSVEADVGQWVGQVEHVVSGEAQHFQSLEDLLGFMARLLTGGTPPPPEGPGGD